MTSPEISSIRWGDTRLSFTIRWSSRRKKTVSLSVDPSGEVQLVAPQHFSVARLSQIVRENAPWIIRKTKHVGIPDPPPSPREFVSGETVLYLGRNYRLKVDSDQGGDTRLCGGWLHVCVPEVAQKQEYVRTALVAWLRQRAEERLPERVALWRVKVGVDLPKVVIADQQKRWGSCDGSGTIRLNWRVIQAPLRLIDYVVVHELVHLRHADHDAAFWRALGVVMPDYERRREDLRRRGTAFTW